jgi:hypothetical protein
MSSCLHISPSSCTQHESTLLEKSTNGFLSGTLYRSKPSAFPFHRILRDSHTIAAICYINMQLHKIILLCCLLCEWFSMTATKSSPQPKSKSPTAPSGASRKGLAVKANASKFLDVIFRKNPIGLDPRTWVFNTTEIGPKYWNDSSIPECFLSRWQDNSTRWQLALSHTETRDLNFLVRVFGIEILDWELGTYNGCFHSQPQ